MGRTSRRPNRANRVIPPRPRDQLRVSVLAYPQDSGATRDALRHDIELAKAAILYADHVDLINLMSPLLMHFTGLRDRGRLAVFDLLAMLDDETLARLGLPSERYPPLLRRMLPRLVEMMDYPQFRAAMPREAVQLYELIEPVTDQMEALLGDMHVDSGAADLAQAVKSGLLTIRGLNGTAEGAAGALRAAAGDLDELARLEDPTKAWAERVLSAIKDDGVRVILDPLSGDIVQSLLALDGYALPDLAARQARAAHLGAGFIARLPTFPEAPMDELLDVRRSLDEPLRNYRNAMNRLSRSLASHPFDTAIASEADELWVSDVEPALSRLDAELLDHGFVKELARSVGEQPTVVLTSAASLCVGLETGVLASIVGGRIGLAGAAWEATRKVGAARDAAADASLRGDFFYLYRLGQV